MITSTTYKQIADMLGEEYTLGQEAISRLDTIPMIVSETDVPALKVPDASVVAYAASYAAEIVRQKHVPISTTLKALVVALQKHVENNFGSVSDFLDAENVAVSPGFASLSNACGYPIPVANVRYISSS